MRIKLKSIFLFIILPFLFNCETRFEDNTRILVKGNLENGFGMPIANAEINIYRGELFVFPFVPLPSFDNEFLLGSNYSDANGQFSVTSLYDKDLYFKIKIDAGETFNKYVYQSNTENYIPESLVFDLNSVVIYQLGTLNYTINRDSGEGNTLEFSFKYIFPSCVEVYDEGILNIEESNCYPEIFDERTTTDDNPNSQGNLLVGVGTAIEFTYSLNDEEEITETFLIDDANYDFTFNY